MEQTAYPKRPLINLDKVATIHDTHVHAECTNKPTKALRPTHLHDAANMVINRFRSYADRERTLCQEFKYNG